MEHIVYENKWWQIISVDTYYILRSKTNACNDQYYVNLTEALKVIGASHDIIEIKKIKRTKKQTAQEIAAILRGESTAENAYLNYLRAWRIQHERAQRKLDATFKKYPYD
jgi:hypothetical protein